MIFSGVVFLCGMRYKHLGISLLLLGTSGIVLAQTINRSSDSLLIKQACINYVQGFYDADVKQMAKAIHPELAKRIVYKDTTGSEMLRQMGASELLFNTAHSKHQVDDGAPIAVEVNIFEINSGMSVAKVSTNKFKFIDYVQLGFIGGEWKIINVLWGFIK